MVVFWLIDMVGLGLSGFCVWCCWGEGVAGKEVFFKGETEGICKCTCGTDT